MSNEHFYNYTSKNLSISLPFFCSHHSVLILSLKTFCFFYLGKQNIKQYTYFRILTWMWIRVLSGFLSGFSNIFNPKMVCISFPKSDKWMLGFAICNQKSFISFSHFTTVAIRKQSRSHICQLLLGLWRRKWEDICKIIFIVGFEL